MQRAVSRAFDFTHKKRLQKLVAGWNVEPEKEPVKVPANQTDFPDDYQKKLKILGAIIFCASFFGFVIGLPLIFFCISLVGSLLYLFSLRLKASKIVKEFDREYPTLLMVLASSVRTGADPVVALTTASQFFPESSVMGQELKKVTTLIQTGTREEEAFQSFGKDIKHPDISLLHGALLLSRKHGASLSECLLRLVKVTRQRQSFRRKIKAALAMQRFSALGIALVALFFCFMQLGTNKNAVIATLNHPYGAKLLYSGGSLIVLGLIWIMFLGRRRI